MKSDSFELSVVQSFLEKSNYSFVKEIRSGEGAAVDFMLVVRESDVSPKVTEGKTSHRQMQSIEHRLKESGVTVGWFIERDSQTQIINSAIESILLNHEDEFSLLVASDPEAEVSIVLIEALAGTDTRHQQAEISKTIRTVYKVFNYQEPEIQFKSSARYPSDLEVMRIMKIYAPFTAMDLRECLQETLGVTLSSEWVSRKVSKFRKRSWIVWNARSETYLLTTEGLTASAGLPGKNSSDVRRALHLARMKW